MVPITVCLITCDREEYTERTLASFAAMNDLTRFRLLHGDDASRTPRNVDLAKSYGFNTVVWNGVRQGGQALRRDLVEVAALSGGEWILLLENDWEWARPFPWAEFEALQALHPEVYCFRLYGAMKERTGRPCNTRHVGKNGQPAGWRPAEGVPGCELGDIHWGAPPAVTRVPWLRFLHHGTRKESESCKKSGQIPHLTARVTENVVYHIGATRTPRFRG